MASRLIFLASDDTLLLFTAHLATKGISASTIEVWLPLSYLKLPCGCRQSIRNLQNSLHPGSSKSSKGSRNYTAVKLTLLLDGGAVTGLHVPQNLPSTDNNSPLASCFGQQSRTTICVSEYNAMLTREDFTLELLSPLHLDTGQFNAHSFRIGAATSAKQADMSDLHVITLGIGRNNAYQKYIQMSLKDLAGLSKWLIPSHLQQPIMYDIKH